VLDDGARASVAIAQDVEVAGSFEGQDISVSMAARDPLYAVTVDFAAPSVAIDVDLGPINLQIPWTSVDPESLSDDTLIVDWKGASASMLLDSDDQLHVGNIGLGDDTSTVTVGNELLLAIGLNKDAGRRFDMTVAAGDLGPRATIEPGFDLEVFVDQSVVDAAAPAHLSGVSYRAALTGSSPTVELFDTGADTLIRVVSGTLTIDASDSAEGIAAEAGDCLAGGMTAGPDDHPVLGTMAAITCPVTVQN
jgi:hypothetical protein